MQAFPGTKCHAVPSLRTRAGPALRSGRIAFARCGPCQRIAPVFSDLAEANPEVEFIKVDVDANEEVASACAIQSMPTFHFYKNGEKVFAFSGASAQTLAEKVLEYK